jgi:hypothetical protein
LVDRFDPTTLETLGMLIEQVPTAALLVESAVDPTRSQNITVSWRRSASGTTTTAPGASAETRELVLSAATVADEPAAERSAGPPVQMPEAG